MHDVYEKANIYKEKMKAFHDQHIKRRMFQVNDQVWLYNSHLKLFPRKLCSGWDGPYVVLELFEGRSVLNSDLRSGKQFKVKNHRLKPYMISEPLAVAYTVNLHLLEVYKNVTTVLIHANIWSLNAQIYISNNLYSTLQI